MEKVSTAKTLEILDAAMALFSSKGFERTTVDEIANRANIGKGTVYLYFTNKEHIFIAIIERGLNDLQNLYEKVSRSQEFYRQIREIIYANLEYVESHQDFYRLFLKEHLNLKLFNDVQTRRILKEKHTKLQKTMMELIQTGIDQGKLRDGEAYDYSVALTGILNHFIINWLINEESQPLTAKVDAILDLILSGIKRCS